MERRHIQYRDFDDVFDDLECLRDHGYESVSGHGLAQSCAILTTAIERSLRKTDVKDSWFHRLIARHYLRKALKTGEIPPGAHLVDDLAPSQPEEQFPDAIERYRKRVMELEATLEFPFHPLFGRLEPEVWRQFHLIFAAHRLSYLVPVAKKEGRGRS